MKWWPWAAHSANLLAGNNSQGEHLLLDVLPLSLGLETMGGLVERVIPAIPHSHARAQDFTTFQRWPNGIGMCMWCEVSVNKSNSAVPARLRFELRGIPPMAAGAARIRVTFQVDADGLLSVFAKEQPGWKLGRVKPSYGLSDDQVAHMLRAKALPPPRLT